MKRNRVRLKHLTARLHGLSTVCLTTVRGSIEHCKPTSHVKTISASRRLDPLVLDAGPSPY